MDIIDFDENEAESNNKVMQSLETVKLLMKDEHVTLARLAKSIKTTAGKYIVIIYLLSLIYSFIFIGIEAELQFLEFYKVLLTHRQKFKVDDSKGMATKKLLLENLKDKIREEANKKRDASDFFGETQHEEGSMTDLMASAKKAKTTDDNVSAFTGDADEGDEDIIGGGNISALNNFTA